MRFELPEYDVNPSAILKNRVAVAIDICTPFIRQIERHYKVSNSEWSILEENGDLKLSYEPMGIQSAADPDLILETVGSVWIKARAKWPQVFMAKGYSDLQMSFGTVSLSNEDFTKAFKARVASEEKEA